MNSTHRAAVLHFLAACLALALGTAAAPAESVKLKNGSTIRGELLRYDERGVSIRLANKNVVSYDADRIASVEAQFGPAHTAADQALEQRGYARAADLYAQALRDESRGWAQARIRAGLVRSLWRSGKAVAAGEEFLNLAAARDDVELMALAPLVWLPSDQPPSDAVPVARRWIADERPMARLLAASWLLALDRDPATAVLQKLQTQSEQRIGWMARAQLWRGRRSPTAEEIARFRDLIEKMPPAIRGGPHWTLATSYEQVGNHLEAALAYLAIPFVYESKGELAAAALLHGARATEKAGLRDDARVLYREVLDTYAGSVHATEAASRLKELETNAKGG